MVCRPQYIVDSWCLQYIVDSWVHMLSGALHVKCKKARLRHDIRRASRFVHLEDGMALLILSVDTRHHPLSYSCTMTNTSSVQILRISLKRRHKVTIGVSCTAQHLSFSFNMTGP